MSVALLQVTTVPNSDGTPGARVRAAGELGCASAPLLRQALAAATARGGEVELDLAEVTFFDCAGLTALETAAGAMPGRLRLVAASTAVHQVLDAFGMQQRFNT